MLSCAICFISARTCWNCPRNPSTSCGRTPAPAAMRRHRESSWSSGVSRSSLVIASIMPWIRRRPCSVSSPLVILSSLPGVPASTSPVSPVCFHCPSCRRKSSRVKSGPVAGSAVARRVFAVGNQISDPQCGQGASALGQEGDNRSRRRQTGQRLGCPSGVREEIVILPPNGLTRRPAAAAITHPNLQGDFRGRGRLLRRIRRAISLRASDLLAPWTWHFQNEARHLLRLVQLDEVLGTRDQEEFGPREELVERPGDAAVQRRIGV